MLHYIPPNVPLPHSIVHHHFPPPTLHPIHLRVFSPPSCALSLSLALRS